MMPKQIELFLRVAVQRIREKFPRVRRIVLFGSYATGKPTKHSDLDLFVVMPSRQRWNERTRALQRLFPERPRAIDFVVRTPREVDERLTTYFCPFTREVMKKGRVLYEIPPRRS